jgi:type II secretory pathway pseudopilin PulG
MGCTIIEILTVSIVSGVVSALIVYLLGKKHANRQIRALENIARNQEDRIGILKDEHDKVINYQPQLQQIIDLEKRKQDWEELTTVGSAFWTLLTEDR